MKSLRARVSLLVALALAVCAKPASAGRPYLTIEGRVTTQRGAPLPNTWVYCLGTRRASAVADSDGYYRLEIPGATLDELQSGALHVRVQPGSKGWRFALSNGATELGLEMRLVRDAAQVARLMVRSNDSSAVRAVVGSVLLDANPRALIRASFLGTKGAVYDSPPAKLDSYDTVTLAGLALSGIDDTDPEGAPATDSAEPMVPESQSVMPPHTNPAPVHAPPHAPPVAPTAAANPAQPPVTTSNVNRNSAPPSQDSPRPAAATQPTPNPAPLHAAITNPLPQGPPPTISQPLMTPPPPPVQQAAPQAAQTGSLPRKWNAAGDRRNRNKPRVIRPGRDGAESGMQDTGYVAPPGIPAPTGSIQSREQPLKPVVTKPDPSAATVDARAPLPGIPVPNVWNSSVPSSGTAQTNTRPGAPQQCDCIVRGTVEVHSEQPLQSRTQVVVSVEDSPGSTTSVELFMGSPRAFEIHTAPCGTHRLRLWTRSKQKFLLVSGEPRVNCEPGGVQQIQLVLEPAARWGAPR